jgi:hypothetical protein
LQLAEAAGDLARAGIVGRGGEIQRAEPLPQVAQVAGGGIGRLDRVAALVHPRVYPESIAPARAAHELPHAHGAGAAHRLAGVAALDQRQIPQVARQPFRLEPSADHRLEAGSPLQEHRHAVPRGTLEIPQVVLHPGMVGISPHVDVPADTAGVECRHQDVIRGADREVFQDRRIRGADLLRRQRLDHRRNQGIAVGGHRCGGSGRDAWGACSQGGDSDA